MSSKYVKSRPVLRLLAMWRGQVKREKRVVDGPVTIFWVGWGGAVGGFTFCGLRFFVQVYTVAVPVISMLDLEREIFGKQCTSKLTLPLSQSLLI